MKELIKKTEQFRDDLADLVRKHDIVALQLTGFVRHNGGLKNLAFSMENDAIDDPFARAMNQRCFQSAISTVMGLPGTPRVLHEAMNIISKGRASGDAGEMPH